MIFPIIIVLAVFILSRVFMPDLSKLKYSKDFLNQIDVYELKEGDEFDLILPENRFEVQVFIKGITEKSGQLAVSRDEKLYKKAKKGIIRAIMVFEDDALKINFFESGSRHKST